MNGLEECLTTDLVEDDVLGGWRLGLCKRRDSSQLITELRERCEVYLDVGVALKKRRRGSHMNITEAMLNVGDEEGRFVAALDIWLSLGGARDEERDQRGDHGAGHEQQA